MCLLSAARHDCNDSGTQLCPPHLKHKASVPPLSAFRPATVIPKAPLWKVEAPDAGLCTQCGKTSCAVNKYLNTEEHFACNRLSSLVGSLCWLSLLPPYCYLQMCWCFHSFDTHTGAHTMSEGFHGVNMFGAIMPDHLIMPGPSGNRASLLIPSPFSTCWSHNSPTMPFNTTKSYLIGR